MTFFGTLKNIFYIIIFIILISFIPAIFSAIGTLHSRYLDPRAQVAVMPIKGVLHESSSIVKQLHKYFKDPAIKAIVLKIECPGSATGTGNIIFNEISFLKKEYNKPVIALVENVCASGGYYIAAAADHIIASPMSIVGSIGVTFSYFFQFKDFLEQYKIKYVPISAGEYKNCTNPFTDLSPAQQKMLQETLDDNYQQFVSDIAKSRNISESSATTWANGKIFTGRQALNLRLIDELGSWTTAIKAIKEKALIETDIKWVHPPKKGFWASLTSNDEDSGDDNSIFSKMVHEACTVIESRYGNHIMH